MSGAATTEEIEYEGLDGAPFHINALAGALAGISEHTVMYPIDSIKTRMQVYTTQPQAIYTGVTQAWTKIASTEGTRRLWRGITSVIAGAGPAHAVYFGTYEFVKEKTGGNSDGNLHVGSTALAGASATIASDAFMNPFDVVKQRMQMHSVTTQSMTQTFSHIYRTEGLGALWLSYPTTLTMTVPFTAVQFTVYEGVKKVLNPTNEYSPLSHVTAGGLAGALGAAVTNPLDVCKTLLQTRGGSDVEAIRKANGMRDAARIIWAREGSNGFFRGIVPRIWVHAPSNAICCIQRSLPFLKPTKRRPTTVTAIEYMINGLGPYIAERGLAKEHPLSLLRDTRLGIDTTHYIDGLLASSNLEPFVTALGGTPLAISSTIEAHLRLLERNGVKPVLVFAGLTTHKPGKPLGHPEDLIGRPQRRQQAWEEWERNKAADARNSFSSSTNVRSSDIQRTVHRLLKHRKTEFMVAPYSAAAQLAYLERHPKQYVHAIWADTDCLLFDTVERLILSVDWEKETFTAISKRDLLADLQLTPEQFLDFALLAGTENCPTLPIFPLFESNIIKPLLGILQTCRTGSQVIMKYNEHPGVRSALYHDTFSRSKSLAKFSLVLASDTGRITPLPLSFPSPNGPPEIPSDLHEVFSYRLPDELFFQYWRALTGSTVLNALTSGYWAEETPLCGGTTDEYKRYVKEQLTEHAQSPRCIAIGLVSSALNSFWTKRQVTAIYYFDTSGAPSNVIPHSSSLAMSVFERVNNWNVGLAFVEEELRRQSSSTIDLMLCLGATANSNLSPLTRTPRNPAKQLEKKDEIVANTLWRFLELRSFINSNHNNTSHAKALHTAMRESRVNDKFQEPLYLALELIRSNMLHAGKYGGKILSGGPNFGSDADKQSMLLVLRVTSIVPVNFHTKAWEGPLSRELLVFNSFLRVLIRSLRCLIESTVMHMILRGDAKRARNDFLDIALSLPFQNETNTAMGIAIKGFCDIVNNMANAQVNAPEEQRASMDAIKDAAVDVVEQHFPAIRGVRSELERGFRFWDAVYRAVKVLKEEKSIAPELFDQFKRADVWLKGFRL